MAAFSNDTKGDHGPQWVGAHVRSPAQPNANTGVFSQGDFCWIGSPQECSGPSGIGPPDAAKSCHQFSDVKLCKEERITVVILRIRVTGPEKEGKRGPQRARMGDDHSGRGEWVPPRRPGAGVDSSYPGFTSADSLNTHGILSSCPPG